MQTVYSGDKKMNHSRWVKSMLTKAPVRCCGLVYRIDKLAILISMILGGVVGDSIIIKCTKCGKRLGKVYTRHLMDS